MYKVSVRGYKVYVRMCKVYIRGYKVCVRVHKCTSECTKCTLGLWCRGDIAMSQVLDANGKEVVLPVSAPNINSQVLVWSYKDYTR